MILRFLASSDILQHLGGAGRGGARGWGGIGEEGQPGGSQGRGSTGRGGGGAIVAHLISLLLGSEDLLVQLLALCLHVATQTLLLLLQLCRCPLQVVSCLLDLHCTISTLKLAVPTIMKYKPCIILPSCMSGTQAYTSLMYTIMLHSVLCFTLH